jgi:Ni/Fe-hydrogenase subunit HybB-like protein
MSAHVAPPRAEPVGGPLFTPAAKVFAIIAAIGGLAVLYRFAAGLGASTALSDGYPWGIWIAFDVVTGTALACGGYALAILIYIVNRGQYHPMIRPAILTSALGYSMAGLSICFDVGRPWLLYRVPLWFRHWNFHSVLFEVAMCVMAYVRVCWLEVSPASPRSSSRAAERPCGRRRRPILPPLRKAMPFIVALGLFPADDAPVVPGQPDALTGKKLHPIWSTPLLPLLFLISCIGWDSRPSSSRRHSPPAAFHRPGIPKCSPGSPRR